MAFSGYSVDSSSPLGPISYGNGAPGVHDGRPTRPETRSASYPVTYKVRQDASGVSLKVTTAVN